MIRQILVATDGSPDAGQALTVASDLARQYGATLFIVHVMSDSPLSPEEQALIDSEYETEIRPGIADTLAGVTVADLPLQRLQALQRDAASQARHLLASKILSDAEDVARAHGAAHVETLQAEGDAAKAILTIAGEKPVDLIVLGSRGLGELRSLLLGSVSHKVSSLARCDVLIAHRPG